MMYKLALVLTKINKYYRICELAIEFFNTIYLNNNSVSKSLLKYVL